jgi:hypothetical protein
MVRKSTAILAVLMAILFSSIVWITLTAVYKWNISWGIEQTQGSLAISESGMAAIPDSDSLYYREDTGIVYIMMTFNYSTDSAFSEGYGFMAPYISENGKYCKYVYGSIMEIQK